MVLVTAIITTIGTDYLRKAIESVKSQTYKNIELIVCYDGNNFNDFKEKIENEFDSLILLNVGPFNNANNARQTGIEQANGEYIALLDDDDYWHEKHIENNILELENLESKKVVLISNSILIAGQKEIRRLPERFFDSSQESVAEYLFCLKNNKKTLMQTSSFFFNKEVGILYNFDRSLTLHQDYDWIIKVDESKEVLIKQTGFNTSFYVVDINQNSISKKSKADNSIRWALKSLGGYPKEVIINFFKNNTLWMMRNENIWNVIKQILNFKKVLGISFLSTLPLFLKILIVKVKIFIKKYWV